MEQSDTFAIILIAITFFACAMGLGYLAYYIAYIGKPIIAKSQQMLRIIGAYLIPLAIGSYLTGSSYPMYTIILPTMFIIVVSFFTDGIIIRGINRKKIRELMINTLNSLKIKYTETLSAFVLNDLGTELIIIFNSSDGVGIRLAKRNNKLIDQIVSELKNQTNENKEYISESTAIFFLLGSVSFIVLGSLFLSLL